VLVAPNTYTGALNRDLSITVINIVLLSESGAANTNIDCESQSPGLTIYDGNDLTTVVQGFTVINGSGGNGGGMRVDLNSAVSLMDCEFEQNTSQDGHGGALSCGSPVQIVRCQFLGNQAYGYGGAMLLTGSYAAEITDCQFVGNESQSSYGGAVAIVDNVTTTFDHCIYSGNTAGGKGGGLYCEGMGLTTLTSCSIRGNSSDESGGGVCSGYLSAFNTDIMDNDAPLGEDGFVFAGTADLRCCLIDPLRWETAYGVLNIDNEGCGTDSECHSWGGVKALYR